MYYIYKGFDEYGFPQEITTGSVQDLMYSFNHLTGNLDWRKDQTGSLNLEEDFGYDNILHSRLTSWQVTGKQQYFATIENSGNIFLNQM